MTLSQKNILQWFYPFLGAFIIANSVLLYFELYWLYVLPIVIAIILLAFLRIDLLFIGIAFLTPISLSLKDTDIGAVISMPAEPLLIFATILFVIRGLVANTFDKRIMLHPISIIVYVYLFWMAVTTFTSELPIVSLKFLLARIWFIVPAYFLAAHAFQNRKNMYRFLWASIIPMVGIILYTLWRHNLFGFTIASAHWVMTPFYNDHTQYGVMLALFVPFLVGFAFKNKWSAIGKVFSIAVAVLFIAALYFSMSRAAWLSTVVAFGVYLCFLFKIRWYFILFSISVLIGLFFTFQTQIIMRLEQNQQTTSGEFYQQIKSMTNISNAPSNLERIVRWRSALRMYRHRPIVGWGPGTYQFVYAPFQKSYEMTIISTNFGDKGNAHSEYLGPLSQQGLPGLLIFICFTIGTIILGALLSVKCRLQKNKNLALWVFLGLVTYFTHGFLNNFLTHDESAVPFFAFVAMLVAIDVYHKQTTEAEKFNNPQLAS